MKKTLILVAGMPRTGKTTFANYLTEKLKITSIYVDKVKELIWDKTYFEKSIWLEIQKYGARNLSLDLACHFCEMLMKSGSSIIFENIWINADKLKNMVEKYDYKVITVLLDGDVEIIHKRFLERENTPERHPSIITNSQFTDLDVFRKATQIFRDFNFGNAKIIVDTSDFSKVDYDDILNKIISF